MTPLAERPTPLPTAPRPTVTIVATERQWTVYAGDRLMLYYDRDCSTLDEVRGLVRHMQALGYTAEAPEEVLS